MIILTGGAGFIGSHLLKKLNEQGEKNILLVDHLSSSSKWKNLLGTHFNSYESKEDFLKKLENKKNIKAIFHLGACSSTTEENLDYLLKNNTEYSKILFSYATEKKIPFIYASSASVYGSGEEGYSDKHNKHEIYRPLNPYGFSKYIFDSWVLSQEKTPSLWFGLRFFNVYGENEHHKGFMKSVVSKAYEEILKNGSLKLFKSHNPNYKDGEQKRDFIYVEDVVSVLLQLWQKKSQKSESGIYNLGSGEARSFYDLGKSMFKALQKKENIDWIPMPENLKAQYQYYTKAPMEKLKSLSFIDQKFHSLEEGILTFVKKKKTLNF